MVNSIYLNLLQNLRNYQEVMAHNCNCDSHHHQHQLQQKDQNVPLQQQQIQHTVGLLLEKFISPYKILYLLDPTQADHFKQRNQSQGCCTSNHITISSSELTSTEQILASMITPAQVTLHLDSILSLCAEKHGNIIEKGKQDKLQVNEEVDKFIMDKVIGECVNHYFFQMLAKEVRKNSSRMHKEIGLWATPASWFQKYRNIKLEFISNTALGQLMSKGFAIMKNFISNNVNIQKEAKLLEKDGKFQERNWIALEKDERSLPKQALKTLSNPQRYVEAVTSQQNYLFPALREASLSLSAFPFELNLKANLFCTVSPNLHICYSSISFVGKLQRGELRFSVMLVLSQSLQVSIENQQKVQLESGDLFIIDNSKHGHKITYNSKESEPLFLLRNFIEVVEKV